MYILYYATLKPFEPQPLPIKESEWQSLISILGAANRAISRYAGILHGMPNPNVLLAPLRTQEAVLSSAIEGTQTTLGEVLEFEASRGTKGEGRREDFQEVLNYRLALSRAEKELKNRPFNLTLLLDLHRVSLSSVRGADKARGRFRTVQNWIGSTGCAIEEAKFVPPDPAAIMAAKDQWEKYYHSDEPDPLVQLAVVHAQFESIHPFLDGNGRLGRRGHPGPGPLATSRSRPARPPLPVTQPPPVSRRASPAGRRRGHPADLARARLIALEPENVVPQPFCPFVSASTPTPQFF
ncbi:MAG: Fic family protein [Verrucomicrobia bacterium]|nr:Fic family protein [Verrucomicrobiota bacterium]